LSHYQIFKAIEDWLMTDEGQDEWPDHFFEDPPGILIPYDPVTGPLRQQPSSETSSLDKSQDDLIMTPLDEALKTARSLKDPAERSTALINLAKLTPGPSTL
jgi:hypothetical protein